MNCIANDSKCNKFRKIYFLFGPAPEEKNISFDVCFNE